MRKRPLYSGEYVQERPVLGLSFAHIGQQGQFVQP